MTKDISAAKAALQRLDRIITSGRIGRSREWGGAGVTITKATQATTAAIPTATAWSISPASALRIKSAAERDDPTGSFYPATRHVFTQFPKELSWLFKKLWVDLGPLFGPYKEEFIGRLGNAADRYTRKTSLQTDRDLLGAVLHEAWVMLEEVGDENFKVLLVAVGREIADDWIEDVEREGYMTTEETRRWFAERGFE